MKSTLARLFSCSGQGGKGKEEGEGEEGALRAVHQGGKKEEEKEKEEEAWLVATSVGRAWPQNKKEKN